MKTAHAFFMKVGVPPFRGSVGRHNEYLVQALETAGYRTRVHGPAAGSKVEWLLPLHLAKARAELVAASPADLAFFDDGGLSTLQKLLIFGAAAAFLLLTVRT